jgi:hypothetical protein
MGYDPSRIEYACPTCNTLPCSCVRTYKPLDHTLFHCTKKHCSYVGYTTNQLSEHNLDRHSIIPIFTMNGHRE